MKKLIIILLFLNCRISFATNYYIANGGSDGAAGTAIGTPWQTIAKLNTATLAAGDSVLFKRGDAFTGTLRVLFSGTISSQIYFGSYGSGQNAIISGFATVGAWTSLGGNQWESTSAISTLPLANVVTVGFASVAMGRTPNTSGGYTQFQSHSTTTSITSSTLTGTPNYTGAELVKRDVNWIISRDSITAQSTGTLTYTVGTGVPYLNGQAYTPLDNNGFFIQNYLPACDTTNEWFYNRSTKKLDIYSVGSPPAAVKVSTIDTLISIQQHDYITFDNLQITGANLYGFWITKAKGIQVTHCKLDQNYDGLIGWNFGTANSSSGFVFTNDTITNSSNKALDVQNEFSTATISTNFLKNNGIMPGMGGSGDGQYQGINVAGASTAVQYNEVDSTGYVAIGFKGSSITINNNYVHNYCFIKDDGGGIYFQQAGASNLVSSNTVLNGIGALAGTAAGFAGGNGVTSAYGIYLDDASSGTIVRGNTTSKNSRAGIYLHNANNIQVLGNTSYDNLKSAFTISDNNATTRSGIVVKNNIFFQKDSSGKANFQNMCVTITSNYNDLGSILTMDSNYFARPIGDSLVFDIDPSNGGGNQILYTLAGWQALYGFDSHSKKSPVKILTTSDLSFNYNTAGSAATQSLSGNYIDVKSAAFNSSITLPAYSSAVLIKAPIIHIAGGTYSGLNVSGKSNTTYIADGVVTYTSQIHLGNTLNIKFDGTYAGTTYGFVYSGTGTVFDPGPGNNVYDSLMGWDFGSGASIIFDGDPSPRMFYRGTPQTCTYYGLYVNQFKMVGVNRLYSGTFQNNPSKLNVAAGMEFYNGDFTCSTAGTSIRISGHSIYALRVKHWRVRGSSLAGGGDEGIMYIEGNSQIEDLYRDSSRNYIERIIISNLQGLPWDQTSWIKNVRDIASLKYGTVDVRLQNDQLADTGTYKLTGGNFYFDRNTSGNKREDNYVSNAVVLGGMMELNGHKDTCYITNSLAFNAYTGSGQDGGSSLIKNNSGGSAGLVTSNNSDRTPGVALPGGLLDANWWAIPGTYLATGNIGAYDINGPTQQCNCSFKFKYSRKLP